MDLISTAKEILIDSGYSVRQSLESPTSFYFEDENLMGFVKAFISLDDLLSKWEIEQKTFLEKNAGKIRAGLAKAWNLYAIFLTQEEPPATQKSQLMEIEEDFRATRKIAKLGILTRTDLINALLPLLPLQKLIALADEDILIKLRDRLDLPEKTKEALLYDGSPAEVTRLLLEEL